MPTRAGEHYCEELSAEDLDLARDTRFSFVNRMSASATIAADSHSYRSILGVKFFVGNAPQAVEVGARSGLMVAPAAPALLEMDRDPVYREALFASDLAITDSGFLVLLWNLMMADDIRRTSGLEYLELLLTRSEFRQRGASFWVMPSPASRDRNLQWLREQEVAVRSKDCYVAPSYQGQNVTDDRLVEEIDRRSPQHVIICLGGGVQEKLGLDLKRRCKSKPAIHCIGAAIGFLSGDQVRIPRWADQWVLGWLFRCASNPFRFVPRYTRAFRLAGVLWRNRAAATTSPRAGI